MLYSKYLITLFSSFAVSLIITCLARKLAIRLSIFDKPITSIKTHKKPTPYLGGVGIFMGFLLSLVLIRYFTHFPSGTLRTLRGLFIGGSCIVALGLIDDIKPRGLHFSVKLFLQIVIAILLINYDVRIKFLKPAYFADILSVFWIVGIINAMNIIDVMDGLSSGVAAIASLTFLLIALPTEEIYVNFASAALAGACLGFIPYNLSTRYKIFMGDTGSLFLGFTLAALSVGTSYTKMNAIALYAPILILGIPLYDTCLVTYLRLRKGKSPFLGSKDHFTLRLEIMGYSRKQIILFVYIICIFLSIAAWLITKISIYNALAVYALIIFMAIYFTKKISKIKIE